MAPKQPQRRGILWRGLRCADAWLCTSDPILSQDIGRKLDGSGKEDLEEETSQTPMFSPSAGFFSNHLTLFSVGNLAAGGADALCETNAAPRLLLRNILHVLWTQALHVSAMTI